MKTILANHFVIGLLFVVTLGFSPPSNALTVTPGTGASHLYTFTGDPVVLSTGPLQLECELALSGYIEKYGSTLTFTIVDGEMSGGLFDLCSTFIFGFPWAASVNVGSTSPDQTLYLTFTGVSLSGCGSGVSSLPAVFTFVNPSSSPYSTLTFNSTIGGSCALSGSVTEISGPLLITNP